MFNLKNPDEETLKRRMQKGLEAGMSPDQALLAARHTEDLTEEQLIEADDPESRVIEPPIADAPPENDYISSVSLPKFDMMGNQVKDIEENDRWSPLEFPAMVEPQPKTREEKLNSIKKRLIEKAKPKTTESSLESTDEELLDEDLVNKNSLADAMKARNDQNYLLNMIRAGDTMSRALSGAGKTIDIQHLYDQNKPVEDELLQRKAAREEQEDIIRLEGDDPNSELSKELRERQAVQFELAGMSDMAAKVRNGKLSYNRLMKLVGTDSSIISGQLARLNKKEIASELAKTEQERKSEKLELDQLKWMEDQSSKLFKSKAFENYQTSMNSLDKANALLNKKKITAEDDIGLIYTTIQGLDPASAVREGEVDLVRLGVSTPGLLLLKIKRWGENPQLLLKENRENLKSLVADLARAAKKRVDFKYSKLIEQAKARKIPEDKLYLLNPYSEADVNLLESANKASKRVVKKQYSPSAKKTKFVYSDGTEEIVDGQK